MEGHFVKYKVLILGIGGFVGHYLAEEFLNNDYEVYGSDKKSSRILPKEVTYYEANLMDAGSICTVVSNTAPDMIINLAAISSVSQSWSIPQTTMSVNVIGTLNIMEAAKRYNPIPKVMFIGSSEEYEVSDKPISEKTPLNANNPYGISKVTQERFADLYREQYGMKVYCVRPFNHTGIGQRDSFVLPSFCKQIAEIEKSGRSGTIKVGNLAVKRDFSHVKDIARAYRIIIESDDCSKIYNIGSGEAHGLDELLNYIVSLSNQSIEVEIDADRFRLVDTPVICCDRTLIEKELGWKPEYSVFDALKEMFEYYRNMN
jgi:GDP-4-dehydro-6-deoxy-D-mannose reductase